MGKDVSFHLVMRLWALCRANFASIRLCHAMFSFGFVVATASWMSVLIRQEGPCFCMHDDGSWAGVLGAPQWRMPATAPAASAVLAGFVSVLASPWLAPLPITLVSCARILSGKVFIEKD